MKALKIGWIGTGVMGSPMAQHLQKKGHKLLVFNRTKSKADELVKNGAEFMQPIEIAKNSDIVFTMLSFPSDVEQIILDEKKGLIKHMKQDSVLIDHTTSTPSLAVRIYEQAKQKQIMSLDAPVSGGDIGAKSGKLVTMVGGEKDAYNQTKELLDCYSLQAELMGGPGCGQHTKVSNQIMIANNMIGVCEALIYGHKAGLNLDQLIKLIQQGAAGSFQLEKLAPKIIQRDFDPGFYVEHLAKDLGIALEESRRMNIGLPGLAQVTQFYQALMAQGGGKLGTQALITVLEQFNNTKIEKYNI